VAVLETDELLLHFSSLHSMLSDGMYRTGTVCTVLVRYVPYWYGMYRTGTVCTVLVRYVSYWYGLYRTGTVCTVLVRYVPYWYGIYQVTYRTGTVYRTVWYFQYGNRPSITDGMYRTGL
jgi:hypothetical protein